MNCDLFQGIHHYPFIFIEIWCHSGSQSCCSESQTSWSELQVEVKTIPQSSCPSSGLLCLWVSYVPSVFLGWILSELSRPYLCILHISSILFKGLVRAKLSGDLKMSIAYWELLKLSQGGLALWKCHVGSKKKEGGETRWGEGRNGKTREESWLLIMKKIT